MLGFHSPMSVLEFFSLLKSFGVLVLPPLDIKRPRASKIDMFRSGAIITGATSGMGLALAKDLISKGWCAVIVSSPKRNVDLTVLRPDTNVSLSWYMF
jgi:hypothetical protein